MPNDEIKNAQGRYPTNQWETVKEESGPIYTIVLVTFKAVHGQNIITCISMKVFTLVFKVNRSPAFIFIEIHVIHVYYFDCGLPGT